MDNHIYDKLALDKATCQTIREKIATGDILVVVSPIIIDELNESPFRGVPNLFPIQQITEAVAIPDHARVDLARASDGEAYKAHLGRSKKSKDAIIAETADSDCDVFVSDDRRCRKRLKEDVGTKCLVLTFDEFKKWLCSL